jgi:hypothetical protein
MAESRYLEGIPSPRGLKHSTRIALIWLLLVILFLLIWQLFGSPGRPDDPLSPLASAAIAFGTFAGVTALVLALRYQQLFAATEPLLDAESSLYHEDFEAAVAKARAIVARSGGVQLSLGAILILVRIADTRSQFEEVVALCDRGLALLAVTSGLYRQQMEPVVHARRAFALAALGRFEEAERSLAQTSRPEAFPGTGALVALARAVLLARSGQDDALLRHVNDIPRLVKNGMRRRERLLFGALRAHTKSKLEPAMRVAGYEIDPELRPWLQAVVPEVVARLEAR